MGSVLSTLAKNYGKAFIAAVALCYFYHVHKYQYKLGTHVQSRYSVMCACCRKITLRFFRFGGKVKWYPGKITQVNEDGTFTVTYDDGDVEESVKKEVSK